MPRTCVMATLALILGGAGLRANQDDRPALSVLAFAATRQSFTAEQALELADDLSTRLVDTGRFRVLPTEWLAGAGASPRVPVAAVRRAAREAGVRYLVSASVSDVTSRTAPTPRTILGTASAILARHQTPYFPVRCAPPPRVQQFSTVQVTVVDAHSGAIVRTVVARTRPSSDALAGPTSPCLGGGGFAGPASTRNRQPSLETLKLANAEIATTLTLPRPITVDLQEEP